MGNNRLARQIREAKYKLEESKWDKIKLKNNKTDDNKILFLNYMSSIFFIIIFKRNFGRLL